jgi:hypothetical protein
LENAVTDLCLKSPAAGSIDLSAALHALADAGLPPDALAAAVEAILRAARPIAEAPPVAPRLVGEA